MSFLGRLQHRLCMFRERRGPGVIAMDPVRISRLPHGGALQ